MECEVNIHCRNGFFEPVSFGDPMKMGIPRPRYNVNLLEKMGSPPPAGCVRVRLLAFWDEVGQVHLVSGRSS